MTRPPNEDPEERRRMAAGPDDGFVISEARVRAALEDALGKVDTTDLTKANELLGAEESNLHQVKSRMQELQVVELQIKNEDLVQNSELRNKFAGRAYKIVVAWMVTIVVFMLLAGIKWPTRPSWIPGFEISDGVLIALLTTTTVNVLGLLLAVVLNLFPPRGK